MEVGKDYNGELIYWEVGDVVQRIAPYEIPKNNGGSKPESYLQINGAPEPGMFYTITGFFITKNSLGLLLMGKKVFYTQTGREVGWKSHSFINLTKRCKPH